MSLAGQLVANGVIAGAIYALVASGFSLIYNVTKLMHFAHGGVLAMGAYFLYSFASARVSFPLAMLLTLVATCAVGEVVNRAVYRRLRARKASSAVQLIASLAAMIFLNAFILGVWGADIKTIPLPYRNAVFDIGGVLITGVQLAIIGVAAVLLLSLGWLMTKTRLGKAMRALADNKDVAQTVGINPEKLYTLTFVVGSLLAGIAGILIGIEQNLHPAMGTSLIIKGFTGAVIGSMLSVPGAVLGSLLLGLVENIGIWWLPSGYKDAIAFALLFVFLLFRPQGILGKKLREA
jgi:branched-chain amino acid transport system permease protein